MAVSMNLLSIPSVLAESLTLLLYTLLAGALSIGGIVAEYTSYQYVASGELMVGLWLAAIGAVMLYAGLYAIGYQKVLRDRAAA